MADETTQGWTRRRFLRTLKRASIAALATLGTSAAYGYFVESSNLEVVDVDICLSHLPRAFHGYTIALISDLHFGPFIGPAQMQPVVARVLSLDVDAIALTGDFVTYGQSHYASMFAEGLAGLQARDGMVAVLGNHDWYCDEGGEVQARLEALGIRVLRNESLTWQRGSESLYVVGVDDVVNGKHDWNAALRGVPERAFVLALVHEPDFADVIANDSRAGLQLSGHSHGGQICLPWWGPVFLPRWGRKYPAGLYELGTLQVYTTRGVGVVSIPIRFCCRPEITRIRLLRT